VFVNTQARIRFDVQVSQKKLVQPVLEAFFLNVVAHSPAGPFQILLSEHERAQVLREVALHVPHEDALPVDVIDSGRPRIPGAVQIVCIAMQVEWIFKQKIRAKISQ
jgi:hypothetical protein